MHTKQTLFTYSTLPAVSSYFAKEPISKTLHACHRFTSFLRCKAIAKNQVCVLGCCDHRIDIVQIVTPIAIAKKNPGDAARNVFQSAAACLSVSARRLA